MLSSQKIKAYSWINSENRKYNAMEIIEMNHYNKNIYLYYNSCLRYGWMITFPK